MYLNFVAIVNVIGFIMSVPVRHVDRDALLKLLATLTTVSTKTRDNATYAVQLAALWLASYDEQLMKGNLSPIEKMSYTLNGFDMFMSNPLRVYDIFSIGDKFPFIEQLSSGFIKADRVKHISLHLFG